VSLNLHELCIMSAYLFKTIVGSADIPTVSAMELVNYTRAGFLEKKRPGIGIGIGMFTV